MSTVIVENHAEHAFDFPVSRTVVGPAGPMGAVVIPDEKARIVFPRAGLRKDARGDRVMTVGTLEITNEQLETLQAHPVARHWFGPGKLVVRGAPAAKKR